MKKSQPSAGDGIVGLVRDAIDGLGDLVSQHLRLARLELVADLHKFGQRARRTATGVILGIIGYIFALAGLAVFLGGQRPVGTWLLAFGGAHGLFAAIAFLRARNVHPGKQLMDTNLEQVSESLATLQRAMTPPAAPAAPALPPNALPTAPLQSTGQPRNGSATVMAPGRS